MKKHMALLLIILFIFSTGCTTSNNNNSKSEETVAEKTTEKSWDDVIVGAKGQTINLYMWGGSTSVNQYIDEFVKPRVLKDYGVTINRVPITDAKDMVNKLASEKQSGNKAGAIDLMWINGENFKMAKENGLLYGPIGNAVPNHTKYVDTTAKDNTLDFGVDTEGYEIPWGKARFVVVYDSAKVQNPPKTIEAFFEYAKAHPGRVTYPAIPDFTGSAFLRHVLYEINGGAEPFIAAQTSDSLKTQYEKTYAFLNTYESYLWRNGKTYPESSAKLDQLFAAGEVDFTMAYNPVHAMNMISTGNFPKTSKTLIFDTGTIANTHYLAIPYNAQHVDGALTAINFLLSPEAQAEKNKPEVWGDFSVLDFTKLSAEEKKYFDAVKLDEHVPTLEEIGQNKLPEMNPTLLVDLEKGWSDHVAK